ncbi:MAG: hypothetical protein JW874_13355 [Spirochaetales bacterium]|nr:hypothetical protein [Spirochaetales bacterium]
MKKIILCALIVLSIVFISGCRTAISVTVTKPAEVNMSGARNIAVFDFTYPRQYRITGMTSDDLFNRIIAAAIARDRLRTDTLERRIADYMTNQLVSGLVGTEYFSVFTPNDVSAAMIGADNPNLGMTDVGLLLGADAIIVGSVDSMDWSDEEYKKERKVYNSKTKKYHVVVERRIKRTVEISVTYRVVNAETGSVIASESDTQTRNDDKELKDRDRLADVDTLFKQAVDNMIPAITKKLAPYKVRETRFLKKDKMKDDRMEQADQFVKGAMYEKALNIFMQVWDDSQNIAAGYNAAIMKDVMGDLEGALEMMNIVLDKYADKEVMAQINRLKAAIEQRTQVEEQMK